jgi:hypothetical protein
MKNLKELIINIYEEKRVENSTKKLLFNDIVIVDDDFVNNLEKKLQRFLFKERGDCFYISVFDFIQFYFVEICLLDEAGVLLIN